MPSNNFDLGIVGLGVMGEAILSPLLSTRTYSPDRVVVSHPRPEKQEQIRAKYGVTVVSDSQDLSGCKILLLGIKPQQFREISPQLQKVRAGLVLSILAGVSLDTLEKTFPGLPIVRAMPNTPSLVGAGMTCFSGNNLVEEAQKEQVKTIFSAVGEAIEVPEKWMNAVTGLSGSGPGYVAVIAEALIDGGVMMGLPRSVALTLTLQTLLGSARYMQITAIDPALLKNQVTSPGGTTIAGIKALEYHGLRAALMEAVMAATLRSGELEVL